MDLSDKGLTLEEEFPTDWARCQRFQYYGVKDSSWKTVLDTGDGFTVVEFDLVY